VPPPAMMMDWICGLATSLASQGTGLSGNSQM
jgi:hypothetical protein